MANIGALMEINDKALLDDLEIARDSAQDAYDNAIRQLTEQNERAGGTETANRAARLLHTVNQLDRLLELLR
jgi:hypothetical protein